MSSEFEKALARAAAERKVLDEAKMVQELELAEKVKLAHSIIDPHLVELGPQVVRTLRELGIPTVGRGQYGSHQLNIDCWVFWCFRYYDDGPVYETFALDSHGQFADSYYEHEPRPIGVGMTDGRRILWQEPKGIGGALLFANPDDRNTYVKRDVTNAGPILQELSDFIAEHIYHEMKK